MHDEEKLKRKDKIQNSGKSKGKMECIIQGKEKKISINLLIRSGIFEDEVGDEYEQIDAGSGRSVMVATTRTRTEQHSRNPTFKENFSPALI